MTSRSPVRAACVLLTAGLVATGCGSSGGHEGVASLGGSGSASSSAATNGSALAYSRCMRAHGVPKFPDPDAQGRLQLRAGPGTGIDPQSPTYQAADRACKALQPQAPPEQRAAARAQMLKYAQCMRAHGITDFPDPDPDGRLTIKAGKGTNLDPNSPQFQRANQACRKYQPGGGKGGGKGGTLGSVNK